MKKTLLGLTTALLLSGVALASDGLVQKADALFANRTPTSGAEDVLPFYEEAARGTNDATAHWKAARALHWLGEHAPRKKKREYYERGIIFGEEAVKLDPDSPEARFWLGALYGSYGESRGVMKSLAMLKPIRQQMDEINRIDEKWNGGAGQRVLGIVDYKVPAIAGGSRKRAEERLTRALEIDAGNPFNNYYMAEFLAESGKKKEALDHLRKVEEAGTSADVDAPDLQLIREKAQALEKKIAG